MMWAFYKKVRMFLRETAQENISAHAASTAFFLFLSLIPLLMLVCAVIPYTPVTEAVLMQFAISLTPHSVNSLVVYLVGEVYDRSGGMLSLSAVMTLWIAAKGMLALMRGLNAINGLCEARSYFLLRFQASLYTIVFLLSLIGTLAVLVFGNTLTRTAVRKMPKIGAALELFLHFRFLFVWAALTFVFAILYAYLPAVRLKFTGQLFGAFFAAVAWSCFSWGFSVYISFFHGFNMYGKLTAIIIVMLWLYFSMYLLLVGAKVNFCFREGIRKTFF